MSDTNRREAYERLFPNSDYDASSTHYLDCHRAHPGCAFHAGFTAGFEAERQHIAAAVREVAAESLDPSYHDPYDEGRSDGIDMACKEILAIINPKGEDR